MNSQLDNQLRLNRFGLQFIDPAIEQEYREWRLELTALLIKWVHIGALALMSLGFVMLYFLYRELFSLIAVHWISIFFPAYSLAVGISFLRSWQKWALPTLVVLQAVGGCGGIWILDQVGSSTGTLIAWAIFVPMFVPFMRAPPAVASLAITPALSMGAFKVIGETLESTISLADSFLLCVPFMVFLSVVVLCLMIDFVSRQGYVKDRIIHAQSQDLAQSQSVIRRYVPGAVAERIFAGEEDSIQRPLRRRVTIVFSDIVGFTDMADRLDPESMTQILNEYMATMADIIEAHDGTLNEFIGDGLMAMFGAPNEMEPEDQALNAVKAAQEMQARLPELNNRWLKLGIGEPLQIRIGINTGVLSVGSFGSEGRMTYTAIGLQTNIAARIQSHCEPGGILLSDASWHLVKDAIDCEPRGEVECKGVHFPVKVYAPKPLEGAT